MNIVRRQPEAAIQPAQRDWDPFSLMREMMRWDPFREMSPLASISGQRDVFVPDVDVKETNEGYTFRADLPGLKEKDIEVSFTGNRLSISGQREEERREESATYYASERSYGSFTRSFTLPVGVNLDKVVAELKDGVLTVMVPKKPEVQPKKIPVAVTTDKK